MILQCRNRTFRLKKDLQLTQSPSPGPNYDHRRYFSKVEGPFNDLLLFTANIDKNKCLHNSKKDSMGKNEFEPNTDLQMLIIETIEGPCDDLIQ